MFKTKLRLAGFLSLASFIGLAALMMTTSPLDNIIYAVFWFGLALVFLISLGYWMVRLQTGQVSSKNRYRIIALSLVFLILLMFRSGQSLSWVDGLILILIGFGLSFYISKRAR